MCILPLFRSPFLVIYSDTYNQYSNTICDFHFYLIQCKCVNDFPSEGAANIFLLKKSTSQTGLVVYKIHQPRGKIYQPLASGRVLTHPLALAID